MHTSVHHIAVVENDGAICDLIAEVLRDEGYIVTCYLSGKTAQRGLVHSLPDLIILDIHLEYPDSVLELLYTLDQSPTTATIPILFTSADRGSLSTLAARVQGRRSALLHKPFDITSLLALVASLLTA